MQILRRYRLIVRRVRSEKDHEVCSIPILVAARRGGDAQPEGLLRIGQARAGLRRGRYGPDAFGCGGRRPDGWNFRTDRVVEERQRESPGHLC